MQEFLPMLQYLLASNVINIIAGDFNYDLLKVSENKLLDVFTDHVQMVNKPTHLSGSLIDHVYIKNILMEEFFINATVENNFFSDKNFVKLHFCKSCSWEY